MGAMPKGKKPSGARAIPAKIVRVVPRGDEGPATWPVITYVNGLTAADEGLVRRARLGSGRSALVPWRHRPGKVVSRSFGHGFETRVILRFRRPAAGDRWLGLAAGIPAAWFGPVPYYELVTVAPDGASERCPRACYSLGECLGPVLDEARRDAIARWIRARKGTAAQRALAAAALRRAA